MAPHGSNKEPVTNSNYMYASQCGSLDQSSSSERPSWFGGGKNAAPLFFLLPCSNISIKITYKR